MNSFAIVRILLIISIFEISLSTIYFQEEFDFGWRQRWVLSDWKKDQQGDVALGASDWYADHDRDVGLQTLTNLKFISLSAKFPSFTNLQKDLVLQFSVQYPQKIDCGGGYIKLLNSDFDQTQFGGETPLLIMFGPDICGPETRIQLILDYKAEGYAWNKHFAAEDDQLTHVYTMVLHPDNTYKIFKDLQPLETGSLFEDWDMLSPRQIPDPEIEMPEDWVEEEMILDPDDVEPADWVKEEYIQDPSSIQPFDWDDEEDGEWESVVIKNPDYKGAYIQAQIANPLYKGDWMPPLIDNPDYVHDDFLYLFDDIGGVGIDVWQVEAGTIFDNIIITDDLSEAQQLAERTYLKMKDIQKEKFEKQDAEEKQREQNVQEIFGSEL